MTPTTQPAEHKEPVLFRELPLGTRFSYIGHPDRVYVILERHGCGLICSDESVRGWTTGQQILSADESEELTARLMVIPTPAPESAIEQAREALKTLLLALSVAKSRALIHGERLNQVGLAEQNRAQFESLCEAAKETGAAALSNLTPATDKQG